METGDHPQIDEADQHHLLSDSDSEEPRDVRVRTKPLIPTVASVNSVLSDNTPPLNVTVPLKKTIPVNLAIPAEADVSPSENYSKIISSILLKRRPGAIGGTGPDQLLPVSECGSFFNVGDNRVVRSVIKEDIVNLGISSMSFNPVSWICVACPKKHSVLDGVGGRRLVIVLADQNFPAVLPSASGKCLAIIRLEQGRLDEIADLLISVLPRGVNLPEGTIVLAGSISHLSNGLSVYATAVVKFVRRLISFFKNKVTPIPFIPPPFGGCSDPSLIRHIVDGCAWLASMSSYELSGLMCSVRRIVLEEGGANTVFAVHYSVSVQLPLSLDDYKSEIFRSNGRRDIPASVPVLSLVSERKFVSGLI